MAATAHISMRLCPFRALRAHFALQADALIAEDINAYLQAHQHKTMLRFITCGSVDDGKSTMIGRLLYDSKMIFEDQLTRLENDSKRASTQSGEIDFALLVDGLAAEREQGITIDVAYRFFTTEKRKFIVADTPGHEQYTRNMVAVFRPNAAFLFQNSFRSYGGIDESAGFQGLCCSTGCFERSTARGSNGSAQG